MQQKTIRNHNGQTYTVQEASDIFKELNDRTASNEQGYNSINELANHVKALIGNQVSGFVTRKTYTEIDAIDPKNQDTAYFVLNDTDVSKNGTWGWDGNSLFQASKTVSQTIDKTNTFEGVSGEAVFKFEKDESIKHFSRYDKSENQFVNFNVRSYTTLRAEVYSVFKELLLFGFDRTKPHRIAYFWVNRQGVSNAQYRFIIQYWDGTAWSDNSYFDLATLTPTIINNQWHINHTVGTKKVIAVVDLKDLPEEIDGQLENSSTSASYVISDKCFDTSEYNLPKIASQKVFEDLQTTDTQIQSVDTQTLNTKNEILYPCFVRNLSDISTLDNEYTTGYKRKLKYQAFKSLKLYGFEKKFKYMISHFWVDSYTTRHLYRIIIKYWNGSSWETYFDTQTISKTDLGVTDGKIFTWDIALGNKRLVAEIDFENLATGDGTTLNSAEPDLIINPACLVDELEAVNKTKQYFNSRRKPTFAFIWDDLNDTDKLIWEIFRDYNFLPSFAIQTSRLNSYNAGEYLDYYKQGASILAHSVTHPAMSNPANITAADVDNEMKNSKKALEDLGFKVSGWATPSSSLDSSFEPQIIKNFGYGFTNLNAGQFNQTVDPIKMARFGLESEMINGNGVQGIKDRIDLAITNNELLVFYGHKMPSTYLDGNGDSQFVESELREVLSYLKTKTDNNECFVLPSDEAVYQYYKTPLV